MQIVPGTSYDYGLAVRFLGRPSWTVALYASRSLSAVFGTLAVFLLALVDPLAGGLLAIHTLAVKYTAQAYLEALPHLASLGAVSALRRSTRARDRWFWLSALAFGAAVASKYAYLPVGCVILYLAIWEKRFRWRDLALYFAFVGTAFWLLNPTLWHDPLSRLADSLFFSRPLLAERARPGIGLSLVPAVRLDISFDAQGRVHALEVGSDGRLWVGTGTGAAVFDGQVWIPFTTASGLPNDVGGVLATYDGKWTTYTPRNSVFSGAEPLTIAQDRERRM